MNRRLAAFALAALALLAPAAASAQEMAPDALVRKSIDEVLGVIKADTKSALTKIVRIDGVVCGANTLPKYRRLNEQRARS